MFISPTEPKPIKELGVVSSIPEQYGVDILWESRLGKVGVQRKVFPGDFLASVHDSRLRREYGQMEGLDLAVLLLEGKGQWTTDGKLLQDRGQSNGRYKWDRCQHRNYLTSVQMRGIVVHNSENTQDTISFVRSLRVWSDKDAHTSLERRGAPVGTGWGKLTNRDYQEYFLQGLPDVGPVIARNVLDVVGMPVKLTASDEELLSVPGIGRGMVRKIRRVFEG